MPYAKPTRRARTTRRRPKPAGVRKRVYKKRNTVFRPQRLLKVGFPKTTAVKLRYVDGVPLNPPVGTLANYAFSANSCFKPNVGAAGHQPMNFDMWSELYGKYIVVGSKITVTFNFGTVAQADGVVYGCILSDDTTYSNNVITVMEQGLTRYKIANANSFKPQAIKAICGFSCKKFFNITNPTDNLTTLGAAVTDNPSNQAYFVIFCGPTPASTIDLTSVMATVSIDYIVIFSEPKEQPQS